MVAVRYFLLRKSWSFNTPLATFIQRCSSLWKLHCFLLH